MKKKKRVVWAWIWDDGLAGMCFYTLKDCKDWYGDQAGKPVKFVEA